MKCAQYGFCGQVTCKNAKTIDFFFEISFFILNSFLCLNRVGQAATLDRDHKRLNFFGGVVGSRILALAPLALKFVGGGLTSTYRTKV